MQNRKTNRLVSFSSKNMVALKSYRPKTDFHPFIVKICGKMQFFRIYARTNAKIENQRKITSGEFKELSNEPSLTLSSLLFAEKIVYVTKKHTQKKHTYIHTKFHSPFSILDIYISGKIAKFKKSPFIVENGAICASGHFR